MRIALFAVCALLASLIGGCGTGLLPHQVTVTNAGPETLGEVTLTYTNHQVDLFSMAPGQSRTLRFIPMTTGDLSISYTVDGVVRTYSANVYIMPSDFLRCRIYIGGETDTHTC